MASTPTPAEPFRNVATWLRVGQGATSIVYVTQGGGTGTASWTPAGDHDEFGVQIGGADSPVNREAPPSRSTCRRASPPRSTRRARGW